MSDRRPFDAYYTPPELADAMVQRLLDRGHLQPHHQVWEPHAGGGAFVSALVRRRISVVASDLNPQAPGVLIEGALAPDHAHDALAGVPYIAGLAEMCRPGTWRPDWVLGNTPFGVETVSACGKCRGRGYTSPPKLRKLMCPACEGERVVQVDLEVRACSGCSCTGHPVSPCTGCEGTGWSIQHPTVVLQHVRAALAVARVGVAFLLRLNFLATEERADTVRELHATSPISPRPSFTEDGATDNHEYIMGVWRIDAPFVALHPFDPLFWTPAPRARRPRASRVAPSGDTVSA